MKLSEAIRVGAAKHPLTHRLLFDTDENGNLRCCALGAAWIGAGNTAPAIPFASTDERNAFWKDMYAAFPFLKQRVFNPVTQIDSQLEFVIAWLNDVGGWQRESIADYVRSLGG